MVVIPTAAAPLGQGKAPPGHSRSSSSDSLRSSGSGTASGEKYQALCRICLEEDSLPNLEAPCGCTGTQRHAHKACIQRWIDEKGHLKCEICDQNYRGDYTVPPPGPALDDLTMFGPTMFIRVDPSGTTRGHDRALDFLDESDNYYQRSPAASWCFTVGGLACARSLPLVRRPARCMDACVQCMDAPRPCLHGDGLGRAVCFVGGHRANTEDQALRAAQLGAASGPV